MYELFAVCRHCERSTVFVAVDPGIDERDFVEQCGGPSKVKGSLNGFVNLEGHVSLKDRAGVAAPEHLPEEILRAFNEGATCVAVKCYNAAGTMFRLCIDLATRPLLPHGEHEGLNARTRRDLGLRLPWLFDHGYLPEALRELSVCVKDDGNDGAHAGTLRKEDADDLLDFTAVLLERMFTEPKRLELAKQRRDERRASQDGAATAGVSGHRG